MRLSAISLFGLVLFVGCAFDQGESIGRTSSDLVAVCSVDASGTVGSNDTFAGTATVFSGFVASGVWTHTVEIPGVDCPGNGRRVGHDLHRGRGHDIGRGRGHCENLAPVFHELIGEVTAGTCSINGHSEATLTGTGTWDGDPVTFTVTPVDDAVAGNSYTLTVSDSSGVVYSVSGPVTSGDIVVIGF